MRQSSVGASHMAILPIAVVVDVDPDWRIAGTSGTAYVGNLQWEGLRRGIPELLHRLEGFCDSQGTPIRFTWMLRSDNQMATVYGEPAHIADEFADFWASRVQAGDEIGWHPHTWRYSKAEQLWYQERSDEDWIRDCLVNGFQSLSRRFPVRVSKAGWTYHDNQTMRIVSDLGVKVDVSAIPGMSYRAVIPGTSLPLGEYDWSRSPQEPYHPRTDDYQLPGNGSALPILEVPNWTFPLGTTRRFLHRLRNRSWRDFANPAKKASLVGGAFRNPPYSVPFICYFHPEELLEPSWLFGMSEVVTNLKKLLVACNNRGLKSRFVVASDLYDSNGG